MALADDFFWTNQTVGNFTNSANWVTNGLGVTIIPTINDNLFFTNSIRPTLNITATVTNANIFVNTVSGGLTQTISAASTHWITNSYIIGQNSGQTGTVISAGAGTLIVTNGNGTGTLLIGQAGRGTLVMTDGTVIVDRLLATNNVVSATNSFFTLNAGTLTIQQSSLIITSNDFSIGNTAGKTATLNITGGTNTIVTPFGNFYIRLGTSTGKGIVNVIGSGTVWSNPASLLVGGAFTSHGNQLNVISGGFAYAGATTVAQNNGSFNNQILISDSGSVFKTGNFKLGSFDANNTLIVSNGGTFISSSANIGIDSPGNNNTAMVVGANSLWTNSGTITLGNVQFGGNANANVMFILGGGKVIDTGATIGLYSSVNDKVVVSDAGSIWTNTGTVTIGLSNGVTGSSLIISNGGSVYNNTGILGLNGSSNRALVTDSNSLWWNTILHAGLGAMNESLVISNTASVVDMTGYVGTASAAMTNNAVVTDSGTIWSNTVRFVVGQTGQVNQVTITNGGRVWSANSTLGEMGASSNNTVLVTSAGSSWITTNQLRIGNYGSSNQVIVAGGGLLQSAFGYVGYTVGATNNTVLVTDTGSMWSNTAGLFISQTGVTSSVTITNGAALFATNIVIAVASGSSGTLSINNNGTLLATNGTRSGALIIGQTGTGTFNLNGGAAVLDQVIVTNNGANFNFNFGTLTVGGNSVVSNTGSTFNFGNTAGTMSTGNIVGGAFQILNATTKLGAVAGSTGMVNVSGSGTIFSNISLMVGDADGGNVVNITNSGVTTVSSTLTLGSTGTSSNNLISILSGGKLFGGSSTALLGSSGSNNTVIVSGIGSAWTNGSGLTVGNSSAFNRLVVSNGALVINTAGTIGSSTSSTSNSVLVSDSGSIWTNSSSLTVGSSGFGNFLTISNGGLVVASTMTVGNGGTGTNNMLSISSSGLLYTAGTSYIGNTGSNNVATISSGGAWTNGGTLTIGSTGAGNQLLLTNGGVLVNSSSTLGNSSGADNNSALVSGSGSVWTNTSSLVIGNSGSGNSLTINNGGVVASAGGTLGTAIIAGSNWVLVTDSGSIWTNSSSVNVGNRGLSGALSVSNGGTVFATALNVGSLSDANSNIFSIYANSKLVSSANSTVGNAGTNNMAIVSGSGALWNGSAILTIGNGAANGSQLIISNGGVVMDSSATIGGASSATRNSVLVSDVGSAWTNSGALTVANSGSGSLLTISNGGLVSAASVTIGSGAGSSGSIDLFSGGLLVSTNSSGTSTFIVGRASTGTVTLAGGRIFADKLLVTNSQASVFTFSSGILNTLQTTVTNGAAFIVGDGIGIATNNLLASATANAHSFANGLVINTNSVLQLNASEQLDDLTVATFQGSTLNLTNFTETLHTLIFNSGSVVSAGATLNVATITNLSGGAAFQTDSGTLGISATVLGVGGLTKTGAGTLLLSGSNSYAGGTTIRAGTLQVSADTNLGVTASSLTFDGGILQTVGSLSNSSRNLIINANKTAIIDSSGFDSAFSGTVTGNGTTAFTKTGTGAITLSGNSAATFLGDTTVSQGQLVVNGALGGAVNVQAGATLTGSGSMKSLWNQGTLNPGNSPGTLTVHGAFTNSGTLVIELASPSSYDQVVVDSGGTATLGGTLSPTLFGGYLPTGSTTFTNIITAAAGVNGTFASGASGTFSSRLKWQTIYFADHVDLAVILDLSSLLSTLNPSQAQLAAALINATDHSSGDLAAVLAILNGLTDEKASKAAYDEILPRKFLAMGAMALNGVRAGEGNLRLHWNDSDHPGWASVGEGSMGLRPIQLAYNADDLNGLLSHSQISSLTPQHSTLNFFITASGLMEDRETTVAQPGYNIGTAAFTTGLDWKFEKLFSAGMATGYAHGSSSMSGSGGSLRVETLPLWLYASASHDRWYFHHALGYAHHIYDITREIEFPGLQRETRASTTGNQANAMGEAGYRVQTGPWSWGPTLSYDYAHVWIDPFDEHGAQSLNLHVNRQEFDSLQTQVGGRVEYKKKIGTAFWMPNLHAGWWHEFADDTRQVEARLAQGSDAFGSWTDTPSRDAAVVGAGLRILFSNDVSFSINYETQAARSEWKNQSLSAGINWRF